MRPGQQRARDRELLLLAAGEPAGGVVEAVAQEREPRQLALDRRGGVVAAESRGRQPRFSPTLRVAKICRPSGTSAIPSRTRRSTASPLISRSR